MRNSLVCSGGNRNGISFDLFHFAMDSITQDIVMAVDIWLGELNVTENKNIVLENLKRRIDRTMSQIELEGIYSILEVGKLQFVAGTWTNILDLLQCEKN